MFGLQKVSLIHIEDIEMHNLDHVMHQFGMHQHFQTLWCPYSPLMGRDQHNDNIYVRLILVRVVVGIIVLSESELSYLIWMSTFCGT